MSKRVVVIGAGVIGLSVAYACTRRGHLVTVLERLPAHRDGCSFGNAGMVVPSHFIPLAAPGMVALGLKWMWNPESPFYIKPRLSWDLLTWAARFWAAATPHRVARVAPLLRDLHLASREAFSALAAEGLEFGLVEKGLLMLCKTAEALEEEAHTAEQARQLGIPCEVLDRRQAAIREPDIEMAIEGAVYFPRDCHLQPERLVEAFEKRIRRAGGTFIWDAEVTGWRTEGNRLAAAKTAAHGEIDGDEFIICAGSWSPGLTHDLQLRLPMQPGKGYSLTLTAPRQLPQTCSILCEARVACTPMGKSLRFGGTMEIAGMDEKSINPRRIHGITRAVPAYFPSFQEADFEGVRPWCGLRPCSPDGLPYLGRTAAAENLIIASGHAMLGVSLAPVTGLLAAGILDGETPKMDLTPLSPDRYA